MITGLGYLLVRGGSALARSLGVSEYGVHLLRKGLYVPSLIIDPVGSVAAFVHEMADMGKECGSETAEKVSNAMDVAVTLDRNISSLSKRTY